MNCEIIAVGTEILLGDILNTNSRFISLELAKLGIGVKYHTTVGDNPDRLAEAVKIAIKRCDTVITSGGLGPTPDDLTKEVCAKCLNVPMHLDEKALKSIKDYFLTTGRQMPENNVKQAYVPDGATVFYNENGTAPGCAYTVGEKTVINLPGPPAELVPMFKRYVVPMLAGDEAGVLVSHNIHIIGLGESKVAQLLCDLFDSENPTVAPYAKNGECRVRVTALGKDEKQAQDLCKSVKDDILARLGDNVYGVDCGSIENAVVTLLASKHKVLAVAESCTAGLISKRITDIAGASEVFHCGIVSYANEIKESELGVKHETLLEHGAVSEQVAKQMAFGVRILSGADIGVSTTGVAGPGCSEKKPAGLCYIGISTAENTYAIKVVTAQQGDNCRDINRTVFATKALDAVRRSLEKGYE